MKDRKRGRESQNDPPRRKKRFPSLTTPVLMFCLLYPSIFGFLYVTGIWDSKLIGILDAKEVGSSAIVDIVFIIVNCVCPFIGSIIYFSTKETMEDD